MNSIWFLETEKPSFPSLSGSIKTDVLIIGGGIAGILCAYKLKEQGIDCVLVEATEICSGITKNTTAKITFAHGLIYDKLLRRDGRERAKMYLEAQRSALEEYRRLASFTPCDFELRDSYVYSLYNAKKIENEVNALESIGQPAELVQNLDIPLNVAAAVRVIDQAQFNPLKLLFALAKNLPIFENTKIREIKQGRAEFERGSIEAKRIIVATHFPLLKHGSYFLKMYQHRSYVIALDGAEDVKGMYVDEAEEGLSFRNYKGLLLLGGGSHRTGKSGGGYRELIKFAKEHYPDAKIVRRFATQDCMTLDAIPYIGRYSKNTPDLFVATGFNKRGMTSAMAGAQILADLVQDKENEYAVVFSPSRSILHPQLAVNAAETLINFITPTAPRCPHLGCALKYNKEEHSWDCPCHGSRFTVGGELIDNPATDDLNLK